MAITTESTIILKESPGQNGFIQSLNNYSCELKLVQTTEKDESSQIYFIKRQKLNIKTQ